MARTQANSNRSRSKQHRLSKPRPNAIPFEAYRLLLEASPTYIRQVVVRVCVSVFTQKLRTYEVVFANDA